MTDKIIHSEQQVHQAINQLATLINDYYANKVSSQAPLITLCIMKGGFVFAGQLFAKLQVTTCLDYIHASRYGQQVIGSQLSWKHYPETDLRDKHVLLLDDIFDQGITLNHIEDWCITQQVASVESAVLCRKIRSDNTQSSRKPRWVGLTVPDEFVYGAGMDVAELKRNSMNIYSKHND